MVLLAASCPADRLARIHVDDDRGGAVAESVGRLEIDLAPGQYVIRATAWGRIAIERVIIGDESAVEIRLDLGRHASAAPILGANAFDSGHANFLDGMLALPNEAGAGLVVLVRHLDGTARPPAVHVGVARGAREIPLPWRDTTGARGAVVDLPPGLCIATVDSDVPTAMAVPVWSGWRTIVVVPVVSGRPVMEHTGLHCLPIGAGWADGQAPADLTEELMGATRDGVAVAEIAAADGGETPLHHLLRGDAAALAEFDPDGLVATADLTALRVEAARRAGVDPPPTSVDEPPVLARSADTLLYHEARHPWSLGEHVSALYASRLASAVLFRWRVDGASPLPPAQPKRWPDDVRRFARRRLRDRSLRRVARPRSGLGPAGRRLLAHVADRSYARRVPPSAAVQEPVGDLVLTTGLPAAALQAGLGQATRAVRRWRQRQIGTGVAALIVVAALVGARLPDGDGIADGGGSNPDEIEVDEEGVVEEDGTPVPIAADDEVETSIATPVEIPVTVNDAQLTDETVVVLDQPPTSGDARVEARVVRYVPDADFVGTDRFTYRLATGDATSDPATIAVRVLPTVRIDDEPSDDTTDMTTHDLVMTVTLASPSPETVTVAYTTMATEGIDAATEGSDFQAKTDVLTFEPGQTEAEFAVTILGDDDQGEGDEVFEVRLSDPRNAIIDPEEGVGTVTIDNYVSVD